MQSDCQNLTLFMKTALILSVLACKAVAETAIPVAFDRSRYEESLSQSPFGLAKVEQPLPQPPGPRPLDSLFVTGLGKLDDGRTYVVLQQPGEARSIRLEGDESVNGFTVKQVKWADHWHDSTVVVTDGSDERSIKFNKQSTPVVPKPEKPTKPPKGTIIKRI
jgi:hypothetical protein